MDAVNRILLCTSLALVCFVCQAQHTLNATPVITTSADLPKINEDLFREKIRKTTPPVYERSAPTSVFVDTVTINNPYIIEDKKEMMYYLIDEKDIDFRNPNKSLKEKTCYVVFRPYEVADVIFTMPAKLSISLDDANISNMIDEKGKLVIYKRRGDFDIYRYAENFTKFLITLVRVDKLKGILHGDYDFVNAPGYSISPVIKSEMPYSQYMLVATPLRPVYVRDKN